MARTIKKNDKKTEDNGKLREIEAKLEAEEEEKELEEMKKKEKKVIDKKSATERKKNTGEKKKGENEKQEEYNDLKEIIKKHKEIFYILFGILILVVVFVISFYLFRNIGRIEYEGMYFVKEKIGTAIVYHHNYYIKDDVNGKIYSYNLYLRNDPRYNNVKVEAESFDFFVGRPFFLGINSTGLSNCSLSMIAMDTLIQFIMYNNNLQKVKIGTVDKNESVEKNMTYVKCEKYPLNTVIIIEGGEESKVIKKENCYIIRVKDCEITQATEKFILEALKHARKTKASND